MGYKNKSLYLKREVIQGEGGEWSERGVERGKGREEMEGGGWGRRRGGGLTVMDGNLLFQALKEEQCCVCWSQRPSASRVEHRVGSDQLHVLTVL